MIKKRNSFLITLLLITSGNPIIYTQAWNSIFLIVVALGLSFYYSKLLKKSFYNSFLVYISVFLLLFITQFINLGSISLSYDLGFIVKIFIGLIIFTIVGENFSITFFDVMYKICLVSLPFYLLHIIIGDRVPKSLLIDENSYSVFFYTFRPRTYEENFIRNSAMFWEPGALVTYINLALFLNFKRFRLILKREKFKFFILILVLITTQSTAGFFLFAVLVALYLLVYSNLNKALVISLFIAFVYLGVFAYNNINFLGDKVQVQYDVALDSNGEFNTTRFGTLLFDLRYINKNPLTGNGFDPVTRYADDPFVARMVLKGENPGLGNGFSDFVASAGIIGMCWYFFILYRNVAKISRTDAIGLMLLLVIAMQSEVWLRFPFFLALPFLTPLLSDDKKKNSHITNLS